MKRFNASLPMVLDSKTGEIRLGRLLNKIESYNCNSNTSLKPCHNNKKDDNISPPCCRGCWIAKRVRFASAAC